MSEASDDLVTRLRAASERTSNYYDDLTREAADTIASLTRKLEEARSMFAESAGFVAAAATKLDPPYDRRAAALADRLLDAALPNCLSRPSGTSEETEKS